MSQLVLCQTFTRRFRALAIFVFLSLTTPVLAENWPHWRGPRFDGTSEATGLPTQWDQKKNVHWRLPLPGDSAATPIVWGDRIFLTSTVKDSSDLLVMAVDSTGEIVWKHSVSQGAFDFSGGMAQFKTETSPASPSPVTDGKNLWVLFGTGTLASFDFDGNQAWSTNLEERYGKFSMYFGLSSSPFVAGNRLFLQVLNTNSQLMLALDKTTGKEIWKHERSTDAREECLHSYTSPQVVTSGARELLLVHGADYLSGHRTADGTELWRHGALNPEESYNPSLRLVATPVYTGGLLIVPSAKRGPVFALDPTGAKGDITGDAKHTRWSLDRGTPDVPSPLIHDGVVYLSGEKGRLTTLDATTGEILYAERVHSAPHRGSPLYADGKVFLIASDGTLSVVKAGRTYELLAKNTVDERLAASLAVANGTLYLRSYEALYAIGEPKQQPKTTTSP